MQFSMSLAALNPPVNRGQQRRTGACTACSSSLHPRPSRGTAPHAKLLSAVPRAPGSRSSRGSRRTGGVMTRMGIRAVETYDSAFQLDPVAEAKLRELLSTSTFCGQVRPQGRGPGATAEKWPSRPLKPGSPWLDQCMHRSLGAVVTEVLQHGQGSDHRA